MSNSFIKINTLSVSKDLADFVTDKSGGQGVLVEVVKYILKSKGIYDSIFQKMRKDIYGA